MMRLNSGITNALDQILEGKLLSEGPSNAFNARAAVPVISIPVAEFEPTH